MSLFNKLTTQGLEESTDNLGGFAPLETAIYTGTIKAMYAGQATSGAVNVTVLLVLADNREYRETVYVTNKNGENFFLNKNDKLKKVPLPGFTVIDDICLITTGEPLAAQATEEKVINVYDFDAKKELPKAVQMIMAAIGQKVSVGIVKTIENKQQKQGDEYVPVADTREVNTIDKVFHPEMKLTVAEARNGISEPKFWDAWDKKNTGNTRDRRTIKDGQGGSSAPPKAGSKAAPAAAQTARKSLFTK